MLQNMKAGSLPYLVKATSSADDLFGRSNNKFSLHLPIAGHEQRYNSGLSISVVDSLWFSIKSSTNHMNAAHKHPANALRTQDLVCNSRVPLRRDLLTHATGWCDHAYPGAFAPYHDKACTS